jgi:hypothetical protein
MVEKRVVTVGSRVWQASPAGEPAPPGWVMVNPDPPPPPAPGDNGKSPLPAPLRVPARSVVAIEKGLALDDRVVVVGLQKARAGAPVALDVWELRPPAK